MALDSKITGVSGTQADVDSNNNLKSNLPTTISQAGFAALAGRNDDGSIISGGRYNRVYVTEGQSVRNSPTHLLWDDDFNYTAQNTGRYKNPATTQTVGYPGGFVTLNSSSNTTASTNSATQTYRYFPLYGKSETHCHTFAMLTQVPQANNVIEFGLFLATLPGGAVPLDGVFFRYNAAGELRGVASFNGTEVQTAAITAPSVNTIHDYLIASFTDNVTYWIDGVLVGSLKYLTDYPAVGQAFMSEAQPYTARTYIGGSSPTLATQFKISEVFIYTAGLDHVRSWSHVKAGLGHMGYEGQSGGALGSTSNITNSQTLTATVPVNTSAIVTGLGGAAIITLTAAANLDGIICSYQNPAGSVNQTARNLIITGCSCSGVVTTIMSTTAWAALAYIAYGHTAVSLATTESATAKAPRRVPVGALGAGTGSATESVGTLIPQIGLSLQSPIVVAPGEFVAFVVKNLSVPASGAVALSIFFDSYWE